MSATGSRDAMDRAEEEPGPSQEPKTLSLPPVEFPRKRKGDLEEMSVHSDLQLDEDLSRSEGEDQPMKVKCFRKPHRQIEKLRRDKLNQLIDELSTMIPACQPLSQKLDKLTVLRKAVQHLRALKGTGSTSTVFSSIHSPLSPEDLHNLLHSTSDSFFLVVSCDRAKILFISDSVSQILNYSQVELTGRSLLDFVHHKDITKVKEQLSSSDLLAPQPLSEAAGGAQVPTDSTFMASLLSTGARRSFFCRMKRVHRSRELGDDQSLPSTSKQNEYYSYCALHCTGYLRLWSSGLTEGSTEEEAAYVPCLVTVCRLHPQVSHQLSTKDIKVKPTEFVTRCAIDGKFTFVEPQATTVLGYLPQELLGTSCYEYFHQDDLQQLAEKHRQVLRSKEKLETHRYKFKTKQGSYVTLQSHWFGFTNPWTKEVEFMVSVNRVVLRGPAEPKDDEGCTSQLVQADSKQIPIIPGLSTDSGTLFYAGSIGTKIANELMDSTRGGSSPSSGASSPFCPIQSLQTSRSALGRGGATGSMAASESESRTEAGPETTVTENTGGSSHLLSPDAVVLPGLRDFTNNDAAMAVIMSLLESDVSVGQSADLDLDWPF